MADDQDDDEARCISLEKSYVHSVYDQTAHHFENSSYKAWPRVRRFLRDLEPGSLVADVGCGHGRYLHVNSRIMTFGSDRCPHLAAIAANDGAAEVAVCDNLQLPYRDGCFDALVSVGVVHHFASQARRRHAVSELARVVRPGGRLIICVWAMEQRRRKFKTQDVLVPWHLKPKLHTEGTKQTLSQRNSLNDDGEDDQNSERSRSDDGCCNNGDDMLQHTHETLAQNAVNNCRNGYKYYAIEPDDVMCEKLAYQRRNSPQKTNSLARQLKRRLSDLFTSRKKEDVKPMTAHVSDKDLAYKRLLERIANDDMEALIRADAHDRLNGFAVREFPLSSRVTSMDGGESLVESPIEAQIFTDENCDTMTTGHAIENSSPYTNGDVCFSSSQSNCAKSDLADLLDNRIGDCSQFGSHNGSKNHDTDVCDCNVSEWTLEEIDLSWDSSSASNVHSDFSGNTSKTYISQNCTNGDIVNGTDSCDELSDPKQFCSNYYHLTTGDIEGNDMPRHCADILHRDADASLLVENVEHFAVDSWKQQNGAHFVPLRSTIVDGAIINTVDNFNTQDDDVFVKLNAGESKCSQNQSRSNRQRSSTSDEDWCIAPARAIANMQRRQAAQREEVPAGASMSCLSPSLSRRLTQSTSALVSISSECSSMFDSDDDLSHVAGDPSPVVPNRDVSPCPPIPSTGVVPQESTADVTLDSSTFTASDAVMTSDIDDDGVKYQRFYHVFTSGELVSLVQDVDCLEVVQSYYDHANWCVIVEKVCVWRI